MTVSCWFRFLRHRHGRAWNATKKRGARGASTRATSGLGSSGARIEQGCREVGSVDHQRQLVHLNNGKVVKAIKLLHRLELIDEDRVDLFKSVRLEVKFGGRLGHA